MDGGQPTSSISDPGLAALVMLLRFLEHRFLDLLAKYNGQGRKLSHKVAAKDYAPRVFAAEKGGIGLKRFEQAMERLLERKEIHVAPHGPAAGHISRRGKIISVVS